jgi:hypothetical protein
MTRQAIECGDLRVVFQWRGDRYGHAIEQRIAEHWKLVLESVEGSPDEEWPRSPVLQSLHVEHRPDGPVSLLVGKAGTSHWSASIESLHAGAGFHFDIACRVQHPPRRLGNAYRYADSLTAPTVHISASVEEPRCRVVPDPDRGICQIEPIVVLSDYPVTIRWRYTIGRNDSAIHSM